MTNLSELELPTPQMYAPSSLWDHVEFYLSIMSSPLVETSFKSFKIAHNFHFEISVSSCFLFLQWKPFSITQLPYTVNA